MNTTPSSKPLYLTIGDPTGIGPEITLKALVERTHTQHPPLVLVGDMTTLEQTACFLGISLQDCLSKNVTCLDTGYKNTLPPGKIVYDALCIAVTACLSGQAQGIVTGPISKANLWEAGYPFPGHTELLAHFARLHTGVCYQPEMLFVYKQLRMLLLTRHIPLSQVSAALTLEGVYHTGDTLIRFLQQQVGIASPKLCFLGVNPHAGEIGGLEEEAVLLPALQMLQKKYGIPEPVLAAGDAAFRGLNPTHPPFDAYVAAYHDQGLIPFKLLAGYEAVNVTIGLPFLRTSVSHGVAMDIAGSGLATPNSLLAALHLAGEYHQLGRIDIPFRQQSVARGC